MKATPPDLRGRVALRIPEAAAALGISERSLRRALPELEGCVLRVGGVVLIGVRGLELWVERRAREETAQAEAEAEALLCDL